MPHDEAMPGIYPMVRAFLVLVSLCGAASSGRAQTGSALPLPVPSVEARRPPAGAVTGASRVERLPDAAAFLRIRGAADDALTAAMLAEEDRQERLLRLADARSHARAALVLRPDDARARFLLGAAIGMGIAYEGGRAKMRSAAEVRELADAILADDARDAGGLHLMGQLHAAAMRLGAIEKFLARTLFGGRVVEDASWESAEAAFRGALAAEPANPAHRLELARVLRDTGRTDEARQELQRIVESTEMGPLADLYRRQAWAKLDALQ